MAIVSLGAPSCIELKQPQEQVQTEEFKWVVDTFDDIKVLQYKVPGFENLSLDQKKLIYYLNQAALSGRDIIFDITTIRATSSLRNSAKPISIRSWHRFRQRSCRTTSVPRNS